MMAWFENLNWPVLFPLVSRNVPLDRPRSTNRPHAAMVKCWSHMCSTPKPTVQPTRVLLSEYVWLQQPGFVNVNEFRTPPHAKPPVTYAIVSPNAKPERVRTVLSQRI